jgi:hypothetical protein
MYTSKEFWMNKFGYTLLTNSLYLYIITPISIIGMVLNLLSLYILCKKKFLKNQLYTYLRVYTLNSLMINSLESLFFLRHSFDYFEISSSIITSYFTSYIYFPLINITFLNASLLDIFLSMDRAFQTFQKFNRLTPNQVCFILMIVSILANLQYFFLVRPSYIDINLNQNYQSHLRIYYLQNTEFSTSLIGKALNYSFYFLRDILIVTIEICLNVYALSILKKYLKLIKGRCFNKNNNYACSNRNTYELVINCQKRLSYNSIYTREDDFKKFYIIQQISRVDQKVTIMIVAMCSLSILGHVFFITMSIYLNYGHNQTYFLLGITASFSITLKHLLNFFIYYSFDKKFRDEFKRINLNRYVYAFRRNSLED